jgi:hypothetical protein
MQKTSAVRTRGIELAIFTSLESLFSKLETSLVGKPKGTTTRSLAEPIRKLFFQHDANANMQTIRLQRAKALVVFSNVANSVLDDSVLDAEALKVEIAREPDAAIKDLLQQVLKSID